MWKWSILTCLIVIVLFPCFALLDQIFPRDNVWVTWAQRTNQSDLCLFLASADNPFRTCLIGYPYFQWKDWEHFTTVNETTVQIANEERMKTNNHSCGRNLTSHQNAFELFLVLSNLTQHASVPLQELNLMGSFSPYGPLVNISEENNCFSNSDSLHANNGTGAVLFNIRRTFDDPAFWKLRHKVSASKMGSWKNASLTFGTQEVKTLGHFKFPPGYFLICGDRAWPGVPENPWGGPCYIGKLTMFTPTYRNLITNAYISQKRSRRSIANIGPDCDPHVRISSLGAAVAMAFFTPGVMAAANWRNIKNLACFAVKEFNITSNILDELMHDVDSVRHAVLQNRAAIYFLLLAQGHGCNEFEGMCCLNLSDHGHSIHAQIKQLRDHFKDLTVNNSWLDSWLTNWGITGWLRDIVKQLFTKGIVIVLLIICIPCLLQCIQNFVHKNVQTVFHKAYPVVKEKGGIVENYLLENGHGKIQEYLLENGHGKMQEHFGYAELGLSNSNIEGH